MSNFASATPGSADWYEGHQVCRGTGRGVLSDLRVGLAWKGWSDLDTNAQAAATQQETDEAGVSGWSPAVLNSLSSLLSQYNHSSFAQAAHNDAARVGSPMSVATMQAALWAAYSAGVSVTTATDTGVVTNVNNHVGSPADYAITAGSTMPVVGSIPPVPTDLVMSGKDCSPWSGAPPATTISAPGITTINPMLLFLLISAAALTGIAIMTSAHGKQGSRW